MKLNKRQSLILDYINKRNGSSINHGYNDSYIQPSEDGNKKTGRILANAILFANGYCP